MSLLDESRDFSLQGSLSPEILAVAVGFYHRHRLAEAAATHHAAVLAPVLLCYLAWIRIIIECIMLYAG
jgi:hypothetical protein